MAGPERGHSEGNGRVNVGAQLVFYDQIPDRVHHLIPLPSVGFVGPPASGQIFLLQLFGLPHQVDSKVAPRNHSKGRIDEAFAIPATLRKER
jgi:hypothetical protein